MGLRWTRIESVDSGRLRPEDRSRGLNEARGRYLEHLSWDEAEQAATRGQVVVIPLGARLKEHGLHLPLNNDWLMAEWLAARVVEALDVLVAPTLQYGYYPAFVEYPGSVSLRRDTFQAVVEDVSRSLARHGWRRLYVLNTGISTCWGLEPARLALADEGITLAYTDIEAGTAAASHLEQQTRGTHADEGETSMMLYMAPDAVRLERAKRDDNPRLGPGPFSRDPDTTRGIYSPTGAWGDPTLASREKGQALSEALVSHVLAEVGALARDDYQPAPPRARFLG